MLSRPITLPVAFVPSKLPSSRIDIELPGVVRLESPANARSLIASVLNGNAGATFPAPGRQVASKWTDRSSISFRFRETLKWIG